MKFSCLKSMFLLPVALATSAFADLSSEGWFATRTDFNFGLNGGPTASYFAADTVDRFGGNWRALQIPLETARNYEDAIEPFFTLTLEAGYKNFFFLIEAPLRKDLEAWYDSDLKTNFTYKPSELDINVPKTGYARYDYDLGFVQVGRFKPNVGPSENTLTVNGGPHHDALWWKFNPAIFRYDFMLMSLNPWLHGDVVDPATGCPPVGTEAYEQKCPEKKKQASNQRDRRYDENYKNLVYHRMGIDIDFLWFSITEMSMVGGKSLEFRSMNPFIFLHNNFAGGYTKASTTIELGSRPAKGSEFYGQVNIEDLKSPVGETGGESNRAMLSYMIGFHQKLHTGAWGDFDLRFDVVRTDPIHNHGRLPLLAYTNRIMYRSNYRDQSDKDFSDMNYVDYPIGYRRGADAFDFWLTVDWVLGRHSVETTWAYLQQGDKELYGSYDDAVAASGVLSGKVEEQWVLDLIYRNQVTDYFKFYLGGGARRYENLDHLKKEDGADFWLRSGVALSFEFLWGTRPAKK